jgi:hypothetical protein
MSVTVNGYVPLSKLPFTLIESTAQRELNP